MESLHHARILHHDISIGNVMVDLSMPAVRVILNDFDLACRVDAKGRPCGTTARHYTGTLPFMALELLYNPGAMHLLRHDLGSLFYVAMWWAVKGTEEEERMATTRLLQLGHWHDMCSMSRARCHGSKILTTCEKRTQK